MPVAAINKSTPEIFDGRITDRTNAPEMLQRTNLTPSPTFYLS
jgi:hypothetical protein